VSANNRIIAAVVALVAAAGAFYMFALKPQRQEAADLQGKISTKQGELDAARALLASNTQAREQYREAYAAVVRLGKAVPADDDVKSLMVQLDSAAKSAKVDFRSIDVTAGASAAPTSNSAGAAAAVQLPPGATVGPAGFPVMPFSFAFTGSFFDLNDFFKKINKMVQAKGDKLRVDGRLLTLDGLQLQPDSAGFPHIRATVNATSYLVSPLEGATGGATAQGPAGATAQPGTTGTTGSGSTPSTPARPRSATSRTGPPIADATSTVPTATPIAPAVTSTASTR
jgi:Tfp pilus assembly protein PilO